MDHLPFKGTSFDALDLVGWEVKRKLAGVLISNVLGESTLPSTHTQKFAVFLNTNDRNIHRTESTFSCHKLETLFVPVANHVPLSCCTVQAIGPFCQVLKHNDPNGRREFEDLRACGWLS